MRPRTRAATVVLAALLLVPSAASGPALAAGPGTPWPHRADGTVWTWGMNGQGQLGDGTLTRRTTPGRPY